MKEQSVDAQSDMHPQREDQQQKARTHLLHELRTPLYSILAATDLLEKSLGRDRPTTIDSGNPSEVVALLRQSTDHLISLINQSLNGFEIQTDRPAPSHLPSPALESKPVQADYPHAPVPALGPGHFPLHPNLEQVAAIVAPQLRQKGLSFECQVADNVPDTLPGNATAFRQILINLLGNAVKFTVQGSVHLAVSREVNAGEQVLTLRVTDSGPGMDEALLARILPAPTEPANAEKPTCVADSAARLEDTSPVVKAPSLQGSPEMLPHESEAQRPGSADASRGEFRAQPGSGLGLSIVQALLEDAGGQLECHSSRGLGTTFTVRLPVADTIPKTIQSPEPIDTPSAIKSVHAAPGNTDATTPTPRHILVAEDNITNRRITALLLSGAGHEVTCVPSAATARAALRDGHFDIAIVDLHLPDASGIELAENAAKTLPVILLTGDADPALTERAIQAGCVALLHKPLQAETLCRVVEAHAPIEAVQSSSGAEANPAALEELFACGADAVELEALIREFVFETRMEVMRMQQAASREDWVEVRSVLHARAGAAQIIGAEALSGLLVELELQAATGDSVVFWTRMVPLETTITRTEAALMQTLDNLRRQKTAGSSRNDVRGRSDDRKNET